MSNNLNRNWSDNGSSKTITFRISQKSKAEYSGNTQVWIKRNVDMTVIEKLTSSLKSTVSSRYASQHSAMRTLQFFPTTICMIPTIRAAFLGPVPLNTNLYTVA